jgi:hypothetical protein
MISLGIILLILGAVLGIPVLFGLGVLLLVLGICVAVLGFVFDVTLFGFKHLF